MDPTLVLRPSPSWLADVDAPMQQQLHQQDDGDKEADTTEEALLLAGLSYFSAVGEPERGFLHELLLQRYAPLLQPGILSNPAHRAWAVEGLVHPSSPSLSLAARCARGYA